MAPSVDAGLRVRMAATLVLAAAVAAAGAAVTYAAVRGFLWMAARSPGGGPAIPPGTADLLAAAGAALFLGAAAYAELRVDRGLGLPAVDARPADPDRHSLLLGAVDRVARQFGCERPTVAVVGTDAPMAMTTGLTAGSTTLVVSTGLLAALGDDELEAVVAHELAHLVNGDAAVMTAAALPMVVADRVRAWSETEGQAAAIEPAARSSAEPSPLLYPVATLFWGLGRMLVARLSRYRELAADRAAAVATGSPAALAAALRTMEAADAHGDARRSAARAFAPVPPAPPEPVQLGPEGRRRPLFVRVRGWARRLFRTHPPLERRLDALRELEVTAETAGAD